MKLPLGVTRSCWDKVLFFFEGDEAKTALWFQTENPFLGDYSPTLYSRLRGPAKLEKWIDTSLWENASPS